MREKRAKFFRQNLGPSDQNLLATLYSRHFLLLRQRPDSIFENVHTENAFSGWLLSFFSVMQDVQHPKKHMLRSSQVYSLNHLCRKQQIFLPLLPATLKNYQITNAMTTIWASKYERKKNTYEIWTPLSICPRFFRGNERILKGLNHVLFPFCWLDLVRWKLIVRAAWEVMLERV